MGDIAIKIEKLGKKYTVGKEKDGSLRGSLNNLFKFNKEKNKEFWALKDISFEVKKGEVIGIIGRNGAGKSTLLKVLSKITKPTEGRVEIFGRVASLLEVGTGFHPELTGRENIYLNGTILGMSRKEVKSKFNEIVEFSGVEKFIDTPVKHYSSGMYVRLAFSVAAHLEPEILIIDEVLAVGDVEFQKKCLGKMEDIANHGRTVLFVSHNIDAILNLCSRAIVVSKGNLSFSGSARQATDFYINAIKSDFKPLNNNLNASTINRNGNGIVKLNNININNSEDILKCGENIEIKFGIINTTNDFIKNVDIVFSIHTSKNLQKLCFLKSSFTNNTFDMAPLQKKEISCIINSLNISEGKYYVKTIIYVQNEVSDWIDSPVLEMNLTFDNYFSSGKGIGANKAILLINANWSEI